MNIFTTFSLKTMLQFRSIHCIRTRQYPFVVTLACLFWLFVGSGCGKVQYKENAGILATSFVMKLDEEVSAPKSESEASESKLTLSFEEVCRKAAFAEPKILSTLSEIQKTEVDVEDASTRRLPRLSMQVEAELPIDESYADEFELTGGLYFKYDLWKAVAQPDETALRRALVDQNLLKLHLYLNEIVGNVSKHLATLSLLAFKIKTKSAALADAEKGHELVELYAKQNRKEGLELLAWKRRLLTLTGDLKQLEQSRRETYDSFLSLMGSTSDKEIVIPQSDEMMARILNVPENLPAPSKIWENHSEARLAEIEYIAAEVMMKLSEMEKYPKLGANLGVGSIPLTGNDGQASVLFQLSLRMPLWDAGDQERKIAKAKINRNVVRERMQLKAVSLWRRAKRARMLYNDSLAYNDHLEKISRDSIIYYQGRKKLVEENRLSSLDLIRDRIEMADTVIMEKEADMKIREAAANYRFAIGYDIIENIIPSLEHDLVNKSSKVIEDEPEQEANLNIISE